MTASSPSSNRGARTSSPLWLRIGFWLCIVIAVAVVVRRMVALASPPSSAPPQMAGLDAAFASHTALTLAHILPALAFVLIVPFYFFAGLRLARWAKRLIYPLGAIVGLTAYAMSRYSVGGWTERSAVLFFNTVFLFSLLRAFLASQAADSNGEGLKQERSGQERANQERSNQERSNREHRWLLRAIVILLGIATTRPVMGIFFATATLTHLVPSQFFGIAFWIGFSINAVTVELWLRYRSRPASEPVLAYDH